MPELPEVETVCRGLMKMLQGYRIEQIELHRLDLRYPFPPLMAECLKGATVIEIERRAKYILMHTDVGYTWLIHLGMSGRLYELTDTTAIGKHDHVVIHLKGKRRVIYQDPRRFGFMDLLPRASILQCNHLKNLLEPLDQTLTAQALHQLLVKTNRPIKTVLLDQRLVVGLGNIYVCEALWRSQIHPLEPAANLTLDQADLLLKSAQEVLRQAIAAGGSTLKDYRQVNGELGYFQHTFSVYNQEKGACQRPLCDGTIERISQSGRSTFFCPSCQRRQS
ncbi:bifunctional DNA-formamidopyrimidine glycosylase/DNA-(apurinic or apyrimidinic site) lyase [Candidatus Odyssella thessalonicensis]|uniref:bifunctional DNA-formamidopyrimidine glycosylase/DNA-(apurinic or apyrimidinic site) lyase n=1 Tax=Candidatus Odyssella thessalonicensis TaxID=84647 RepID=UPI000225AEF4|nr:bifunctional DNA-formamidopyrimidine glycosylase/DNA-(apurinic or apyrimidinic site) lyase [Candidatus Odyssella thessalonicensis]